MLAAVTKINLPSCLGFCFQILPILRDGTACHACIQSLKHFVACADLHREKKKRKELAIYATFDYIQKELLNF